MSNLEATQVIAGFIVGFVFSFVGMLLGPVIFASLDVTSPEIYVDIMTPDGNFDADAGMALSESLRDAYRALFGAALGFVIGSPVGVYLVAKRRGVEGSFWLAVLGNVLLGGFFLALSYLGIVGSGRGNVLGHFCIFPVVLSPVVATIGFHLLGTRRPAANEVQTAMGGQLPASYDRQVKLGCMLLFVFIFACLLLVALNLLGYP